MLPTGDTLILLNVRISQKNDLDLNIRWHAGHFHNYYNGLSIQFSGVKLNQYYPFKRCLQTR